MGLRTATYIMQRISNAIIFVHNSIGFWSIGYIDDYGSAEMPANAWASYNAMHQIMKSVGLKEAEHKAVSPSTRMEFLGNTLDTIKMTLEVSPQRLIELKELMKKWLLKVRYSKKQLQSLIGKLSFVTNCVHAGRIFISRLIEQLSLADDKCVNIMTQEMRKDVQWWLKFLPEYNGTSILWLQDMIEPDILIASDASMIGGRAVCNKEYFHVKFPETILQITSTIAQREILTIMIAVKLWSRTLEGKIIRFSTDNQVSLHAINAGRSKDKFTMQCVREIAWFSAKYNFLVKMVYVNTKDNIIPDALLRWYQSTEARRTFKRNSNRTWCRRSIDKKLISFQSSW